MFDNSASSLAGFLLCVHGPAEQGEGQVSLRDLPLVALALLSLILVALLLLAALGWSASAALCAIGSAGLIAAELRNRLA
ncbi:hypothetical protein [Streptomyces mashuensis]|uniref:hypothetical protein n=1 Tax=Streptomyces mashuensis TaxID=33904 RepID=UPI00167EAE3A|nr:hypothetical protein [Streptomyces mashuensis]